MKKLLLVLTLTCLAASGFSARAQDVINPNHSVVRFEVFTAGTNFGSIDIELFDQEKPQTVQNFLRYVFSGVYSDLVLHLLLPGQILQAGHVRVPNLPLTNRFAGFTPGAKFAPIPNEFSVGPQLSNDFGTISMARDPGNPNSADSEWFFNLGDNAALNTGGGYAVFGRVVNTVSDRTGTNLLNYFNTLSDGHGIATNLVVNFEGLFAPVSTDRPPVNTNGLSGSGTLVADLFTIRSSILQRPPSVDTNHTIVRFDLITDGIFLGGIDIELFDQEKPETVRNFLLYVYSGVYSDLVLHRVEPNFVLQGGRVRILNPFSSADFTTYTPGVNWGRITNEYSVGPELHNDYGTIAMARAGGDTNSASAEFFFNLTNNPHLNDVDGGFTVFGRVVGTSNDFTGTNMLNKFNTLTRENGIGSAFILDYFDFLTELPVSAIHYTVSTNGGTVVTNVAPVQYRDLFTVRSSVIQGNQIPDASAPTLSVNNSGEMIRTTNATIHLSGTASDNAEIYRILFDGPLGRFTVAGKSAWTADVPLTPGTNHFLVRSLDYFGNLSTGVDLVVYYSRPSVLTLETIGKGKVTGLANGQLLEVGLTYPVTAKASKGYYFAGWRGDVSSYNPSINFTMGETGRLVARFSKTLLGMVPGTYQGIFAPSSNGPPESSGFITFKLANNGIYSGKLQPLGASYGIRGQFDTTGRSLITGQLGTNLLALSLAWAGEGSESYFGGYSDGHFISQLTLWRVQTFSATNPAPAGLYTFNLSPPLANNGVTDGSGFGNVTIDGAGRVDITGLLADNVALKQKTALLKGNRFPFFYSVKKGDSIFGMATIATNGTFSANARWFASAFPGNTNQSVKLDGSRYTPPSQARLFNWTNGIITLSGDGLAEPITSEVVLADNGTFSIPSNPHNIQINVTNANGWIGGTFTHPVSQAPTVLRGAVLQSSNSAAGFFPGATNGGFTIRRVP